MYLIFEQFMFPQMSHSVAPTPLFLNHTMAQMHLLSTSMIQTLKPRDVLTKVHGMLL